LTKKDVGSITKETMKLLVETEWYKTFVKDMHEPVVSDADEKEEADEGDDGDAAPGSTTKIIFDKKEAARSVYAKLMSGDSTVTNVWSNLQNTDSLYCEMLRMNIHYYMRKGTIILLGCYDDVYFTHFEYYRTVVLCIQSKAYSTPWRH
jgi:hypothetical protein